MLPRESAALCDDGRYLALKYPFRDGEPLVIVVPQDGGVRFVRWQDGRVVYFDQIATGPWQV